MHTWKGGEKEAMSKTVYDKVLQVAFDFSNKKLSIKIKSLEDDICYHILA